MKRGSLVIVLALLAACAGILGYKTARTTSVFPHRAHVVSGVSCTRCHAGIDKGGAQLHLPTDATCTTAGCHVKPHDTRSCASCHVSADQIAELVAVRENLIFDHATHLPRTNNNCMRCHAGVQTDDEHMRPPMALCFRCHDDAQRARTCDGCHVDLAEEGTLPASHLAHEGDWINLHGTRASSSGDLCETCHKESFCAACHGRTVPALPHERRLADPFAASVHRAGFAARHALEARSDPGACMTCHAPSRCQACHADKGIAQNANGNPHPPGWVGATSSENLHGREARRDPMSCAGCHGGAGEKLCVSCHAVGGIGGSPHPPGWSSDRPLSSMPCRMCHPTGASR